MPVIAETAPATASFWGRRKKWTRAECEIIQSTGVLSQQKVELIEGDLLDKMGKNRPHTNALIFVQDWLVRVFGVVYVNPETTIDIAPEDNPTSEPEPDLIVLSKPSLMFRAANPRPSDIRLLIEISDSSLDLDLKVKASLYARAGIPEYWVLDVNREELWVHRNPADGKYKSITVYNKQESVCPLAAPGQEFRVAEAFPE